jgi:hypothetical protein
VTPEQAAREVASTLDARSAWNYDTIECRALEIAAEGFRQFADLLSAPVSEGGPGEG